MKNIGLYDYVKDMDGNIGYVEAIDDKDISIDWYGINKKGFLKESIKNLELSKISKNEELIIGDKVKLEKMFYDKNTDNNPFEIDGKVVEDDGFWIHVEWSNGFWNTYKRTDVDLIKIN